MDTGPRFCRNYAEKGQPAGKGRKKKKKEKKHVTNKQPVVKGLKKKKKNQRRFRHRKSLWPIPPQKTLPELSRHR
jgi:hypothetical protein